MFYGVSMFFILNVFCCTYIFMFLYFEMHLKGQTWFMQLCKSKCQTRVPVNILDIYSYCTCSTEHSVENKHGTHHVVSGHWLNQLVLVVSYNNAPSGNTETAACVCITFGFFMSDISLAYFACIRVLAWIMLVLNLCAFTNLCCFLVHVLKYMAFKGCAFAFFLRATIETIAILAEFVLQWHFNQTLFLDQSSTPSTAATLHFSKRFTI